MDSEDQKNEVAEKEEKPEGGEESPESKEQSQDFGKIFEQIRDKASVIEKRDEQKSTEEKEDKVDESPKEEGKGEEEPKTEEKPAVEEKKEETPTKEEEEAKKEKEKEEVKKIEAELRRLELEKKKMIKIRGIRTPVDKLYQIIKENEKITLPDLANKLRVDEDTVERWTQYLKGLVKLEYPLNFLAKPYVILEEFEDKPKEEPIKEEEILDSYAIMADKVPAKITLYNTEKEPMPIYKAEFPVMDDATHQMLNYFAEELTNTIPIEIEEIADPKKMVHLKDRFYFEALKLLKKDFKLPEEDLGLLAGLILHRTYGLGKVELLLNDDWLEEVCVNTSHIPLTAYHKRFGWVKTNLLLGDEKTIYNYASQIGRKVGRNITNLDPIMDAHLLSGDRVNATLFPISSFGNTITIRKFAREPWTIPHFVSPELQTMSKEIAAFIWLCFQYELNIIVAGGTASGKTSVLNCLCSLIQPTHRVISIEDTREINLPKYLYWNWIPMTTRAPNPSGKGEVSMLNLIHSSLRMRPDRIVLGEIRRQREAEVLFEAMHTGHSVYATMHADSARNLKRRLLEPPISLSSAEVEALHLAIVQYRDRRLGIRRTFEVAELLPGSEGKELDLNYLFRYNKRTNQFSKINESSRIVEELNLHAGMTRREISEDLEGKAKVLQWMLDNNINTLNEVGIVIGNYYKHPDLILELVSKGS
ncbi:type II/IV secretion system ATPase subunit [Candidatus Altiarchaeota archaeon]